MDIYVRDKEWGNLTDNKWSLGNVWKLYWWPQSLSHKHRTATYLRLGKIWLTALTFTVFGDPLQVASTSWLLRGWKSKTCNFWVTTSNCKQMHRLPGGRQPVTTQLWANKDWLQSLSGRLATCCNRYKSLCSREGNSSMSLYDRKIDPTGCHMVVLWLYSYINANLQSTYVILLLNYHPVATTGKFFDFCLSSRFGLDSECKYVNVCVSRQWSICNWRKQIINNWWQIITVLLSQTDCTQFPTWPHSITIASDSRLILSHCPPFCHLDTPKSLWIWQLTENGHKKTRLKHLRCQQWSE